MNLARFSSVESFHKLGQLHATRIQCLDGWLRGLVEGKEDDDAAHDQPKLEPRLFDV